MERKIIEHCAPTLAGLKTANMFNYKFSSMDVLYVELEKANQILNQKGLYVEILKVKEYRALIYVYRANRLQKDLEKAGVDVLLRRYGYSNCRLFDCLVHLKERLKEFDCFPHEIGVFLGYPLEDVIGFIEQGGKNCKCCGMWKVYSNECETQQLFTKFKKCTDVYVKVFTEGRTLMQLTVAA